MAMRNREVEGIVIVLRSSLLLNPFAHQHDLKNTTRRRT
jgi:hypothetical protein